MESCLSNDGLFLINSNEKNENRNTFINLVFAHILWDGNSSVLLLCVLSLARNMLPALTIPFLLFIFDQKKIKSDTRRLSSNRDPVRTGLMCDDFYHLNVLQEGDGASGKGQLLCFNCGIHCSQLQATAKGSLCSTCAGHLK